MRKVVSSLYVSLDGVTSSPEKWQFDHFDPGVMASLGASVASQDNVLLGRVTYEEWAAFWPTSRNEPFATFINQTPKYVVSTTLKKVEWANSTLVKEPLKDAVQELKRQTGKDIGVAGSVTLVQSLLQEDLLDELTLMVHPVIVGSGRQFFREAQAPKRLRLTGSQVTPTGVAILTYQRRNG